MFERIVYDGYPNFDLRSDQMGNFLRTRKIQVMDCMLLNMMSRLRLYGVLARKTDCDQLQVHVLICIRANIKRHKIDNKVNLILCIR